MPTLEPHQVRQVAESFGTDAARYDRARPRYPQELITRIAENRPEVLDVGCGTGIASRQLQAAGCQVLGVEPDARMAEYARERGLEVEVAKIETWDPHGRRFDALTAAQCWHWVDPVAGAVKAAEVLRPGGLLAAFWNVDKLPPELEPASQAIYQQVLPAVTTQTDPYKVMVGTAAGAIEQDGRFHAPEQWRFEWERQYTRDEWLDRVPTNGGMNLLPPDKLAEVLTDLGEAIDAIGGSFTMRYTTIAITAIRN
ncbi:class I SAM-dependent methyltransferase [Kibdelosporangium aridum]|uniref:Class I SAM-dependent methyltransferase n=1 Tax=Kibdelosporangium aridum TaxID=2030 RepID=A0A428ZD55_KIBAR|nr:class I SAM-dependent methyltransferase [Kibdelosporangium aridum]RSM85976.1 class I SAM-dependent methyltransferase [Kibdelosporangium aridum]